MAPERTDPPSPPSGGEAHHHSEARRCVEDLETIISGHLSAAQKALTNELEEVLASLRREYQEAHAQTQEQAHKVLSRARTVSVEVQTTDQELMDKLHSIESTDNCTAEAHGGSVAVSEPAAEPTVSAARDLQELALEVAAQPTMVGTTTSAVPEPAHWPSTDGVLTGVMPPLPGSCGHMGMKSWNLESRRASSGNGPQSRRASVAGSSHQLAIARRRASAASRGSGAEQLPSVFDLWPTWKVEHNTFADRIFRVRSLKPCDDTIVEERSFQVSQLFPAWGVISPTSLFSMAWNIMFMAVLCYELVVLPLRVFDLPKGGLLFALSIFAIVFWSVDVVMSFSVGYYTKEGTIIMDRRQIVVKYARSWMIPDTLIVSLDWFLLVSEQSDVTSLPSLLRFGKAFRYLRVLRVFRLLRLRKLRETIHLLDEFVSSEYFSILQNVFLNMIGIMVISHFLGCLWFYVGNQGVAEYPSWVHVYSFHEKEWSYQYLTSLHWSLTQITPGSMEIQPQNIPERAFAVLVLILGIIVFSSIVSSITSAVNNLKSIGARYDRQRRAMRRFFREQGVSKDLACRVTRYADNIIRPQQKKVAPQEVELLPLLPNSLYMDVMLELFAQDIEAHPLFQALHMESKAIMQKVCCALETTNTPKDDIIFLPGETAQAMYVVLHGHFRYQMREVDKVVLKERQWFCEPVLWTPWVHQGSMEAISDCETLVLPSSKFQEMVSQHRSEMRLIKKYACEFVRAMNEIAGHIHIESKSAASSERESVGCETGLSDLMTIESALALLEESAGPISSPRASADFLH